jgi:hypothetical protein
LEHSQTARALYHFSREESTKTTENANKRRENKKDILYIKQPIVKPKVN